MDLEICAKPTYSDLQQEANSLVLTGIEVLGEVTSHVLHLSGVNYNHTITSLEFPNPILFYVSKMPIDENILLCGAPYGAKIRANVATIAFSSLYKVSHPSPLTDSSSHLC
jgi:hypothetical protein